MRSAIKDVNRSQRSVHVLQLRFSYKISLTNVISLLTTALNNSVKTYKLMNKEHSYDIKCIIKEKLGKNVKILL